MTARRPGLDLRRPARLRVPGAVELIVTPAALARLRRRDPCVTAQLYVVLSDPGAVGLEVRRTRETLTLDVAEAATVKE